ncbi:MAG: class IV adenylate cyclase [Phycisphaerales bacterium]
MKIEIEAKLRLEGEADAAAVEQRLVQLNGRLVATMREVNIFVDTRENRLKATDRGLRVRLVETLDDATHGGDGTTAKPQAAGAGVTITFKGPRSVGRLKSRREIEVDVDSEEGALNLLAELGYHESIRFEKRRKRYLLDGCTIELDEMPYLGHFLEIEGPDDATILAVREKLGLSGRPLIHSSYAAMLATYLSDHGLTERHVVFG